MYRTNAKPIVTANVIPPKSFWHKPVILFWVTLYWAFKSSYFKTKMITATLRSIPKEMFYCVDCHQEDCTCPDWSQQ
jgi:hypothetical protein